MRPNARPNRSTLADRPSADADRRERRRIARRKAVPVVVALVALITIPVLIYVLLGTPLFQAPTAIPQGIPPNLGRMGKAMGGGTLIALLALVWLVALVSLLLDGSHIWRARRRRRNLACPSCGHREGVLPFGHQVVAGTGWEELTCPQCRKVWHVRL